MTNSLTDLRYPLAAAALAAGARPKAIRNWIERGQVPGLDVGVSRGTGWLKFSALDILTLAYVRRLVDYGVGVELAALIASEWTAYPHLRSYRHPPLAVLAAGPGGIAVVCRTAAGGWEARVSRLGALPSTGADAWLTIDLGAVAARVAATLDDLHGTAAERSILENE